MIKRVVCITGAVSQPRFVKRVNSLVEAGFDVIVVGYDRGIYKDNKLPECVPFINKGHQIDGGGYLSKVVSGYKDVTELIEKYSNDETIFYSFSFLTAIWFYCKKNKYIYEISDILYGYKKMRIIQPFMKWLDKNVIKSSFFTIMTSEGFKRYFFGDKKMDNIIVHPNKLSSKLKLNSERTVLKPNIQSLNFSFVGSIRYFDTVLRFAKVVGENFPQHMFHFFGDSSSVADFKEQCKEYDNVLFHGAFKNPEDLEAIYSQTDIVVACYENSNLNEKIAEPNKMYEAMYFCKPIVVSTDTFLAYQVKKYKCGYAINAYEDKDIISFIKNIQLNDIVSISQNELAVGVEFLTDQPKVIIDRIREIKI